MSSKYQKNYNIYLFSLKGVFSCNYHAFGYNMSQENAKKSITRLFDWHFITGYRPKYKTENDKESP